jgi:hypothetical protein
MQYSYARDVDYISAAFLMFSKDLYTNMGGLDPLLGNGYFADTDLAIAMASKGFKIMYQPLAMVGVSMRALQGDCAVPSHHNRPACTAFTFPSNAGLPWRTRCPA